MLDFLNRLLDDGRGSEARVRPLIPSIFEPDHRIPVFSTLDEEERDRELLEDNQGRRQAQPSPIAGISDNQSESEGTGSNEFSFPESEFPQQENKKPDNKLDSYDESFSSFLKPENPKIRPLIPSLIEKHVNHKTEQIQSRRDYLTKKEDSAPIIRVTIGRIEVRAVMKPEPPARRIEPPKPKLSLEDYLRNNGGDKP